MPTVHMGSIYQYCIRFLDQYHTCKRRHVKIIPFITSVRDTFLPSFFTLIFSWSVTFYSDTFKGLKSKQEERERGRETK